MQPDEAFSTLIGRIYDCALDKALWTDVLAEITRAVNGCMADLSILNPLEGAIQVTAFHNYPEEVLELTQANMHLNPVAAIGLTAPLCEPMCTSRNLDMEAFHNSRYWQTCFAGRGYYDYIAVPITRSISSFGAWGVMGDQARGAFGDDDLKLARLLSPHIRRSVEISGVLGHQRVEAGTLRGALDALAAAALIVQRNGQILFRNAHAEAELARGIIFRENKGRLIGVTPDALKLVAALAAQGRTKHQRGRDDYLTDGTGRMLHASWVELEQAGEELGSPLLILLRQPETEVTTPLSAAATLYRLTTGETQVLAQVLNGHTLAEVAQILGVARSTAKSHLDAIYGKTNTHRQAELVQLVMSLASPLRAQE